MATKKRIWWKQLPARSARLTCYISYSPDDGAPYAHELARTLNEHGLRVFMGTEEGNPGAMFAETFRNQLRDANILILVGSPSAFKSQSILFELNFFSPLLDRKIIPIMFLGLIPFDDVPDFLKDTGWQAEEMANLLIGPSERIISNILGEFQHISASIPPSVIEEQPRERQKFDVRTEPENGKRQEKRPLNEGKLILVGRGEVGKTSVVRRLVDNDFRGDESKTQGINISVWPLECSSEKYRLNIWDFGGQEIMHATHQFFLTERSLYLLVLNGREGGEDVDAEYWLKHIESFGAESPVIVVQNKVGQHPFELNYRGLQARYPQIRVFVKTDCKDGTGIDELRAAIREAVEEMPETRIEFPADWFAVKQRLEDAEDEYMSYERFRGLCAEEGIEEESDRETLRWVLHCLGIALNYSDDSRLRETSVLKPEWVTQGIYSLLNAKRIAEREGELHLDDLQHLLPARRYPTDKHLFLLELMRKFSLCFAFPDEEQRYLIPELLGKEEPEEAAAFPPGDCLNFEYHYGVLPEGLIPRFIVRSHTLSRGRARWRSGVILAYEDCKALVKAEPAERRVLVRVKEGDAGARRRLLALVRYEFDRINAEFKDRLEAEPKVPLTDFPEFAVDYKKLAAFEKKGVRSFPEFIGERVVTVQVSELLNGVDLEKQRSVSLETITQAKAVFFSYSHKDEWLRDELETHLKLLQRQGIISTWHDRKLLPGGGWGDEIDSRLERAKIILLLVSSDFLASDYCWDKEVRRAVERHEAREATVIPILLRSCDWKGAPFEKIKGLPRDMTPVMSFEHRDAAWTAIAASIREVAENLNHPKGRA
ncbi:MAG: COR domain-containing protein [Pyrinomonadaceae bacterium]